MSWHLRWLSRIFKILIWKLQNIETYNFCFNCLPIRIFVLFLAITVEIMSNIGRSTLELQNSYNLTSFDLEDIDPRS